ncbi:MAG: hypothetical protein HRT71_15585 [Flavobacteriales bacterium]|nr:hypothetical protein [Flavobacteriales bacterium]
MVIALLPSCYVSQYVVSSHHVPIFEKSEELRGATYVSLSGIDLQLAYSITDHVPIILNYTGGIKGRNYFELGSGYFKNLTDEVQLQLYGGTGYGVLNREISNMGVFHTVDKRIEAEYYQFYLQPSMSYKINPAIQIVLDVKLKYANYLSYRYTETSFDRFNSSKTIDSATPAFLEGYLLETGFKLLAGKRNTKFTFQTFYSHYAFNSNLSSNDGLPIYHF